MLNLPSKYCKSGLYQLSSETRIRPTSQTAITGNCLSFQFFKLPKSKILNFQWTFQTTRCQTPQFSKPDMGLMVPKKSQNVTQNNLQHKIFPENEKKKTSKKKKKDRRLWKKGYKSAFGFCICICICFCFFFICRKIVEGDCCLFENSGRNNKGRERRRL